MGRIWLVRCPKSLYGRARSEILFRDCAARLVQANSLEDVMRLGKACRAAEVGVAISAVSGETEEVIGGLARIRRELAGSEVLVLSIGCGALDIARMVHSGATEVIAVDVDGPVEGWASPSTAQGACRENDDDVQAIGGEGPTDDDFAPSGGQWPPIDDLEEVETGGWSDRSPGDMDFSARPHRPAPPSLDICKVAARAAAGVAAEGGDAHRAPLVVAIAGRGGVGRTTIVAALAACAARAGLRAAVLDLDLMSGDMPAVLGVSSFKGLEGLLAHERDGVLAESDVEATAMRIGPGLTLWGPLTGGERAELFGGPVEHLIAMLRPAADVIFVDTSCYWGDAVAAAVGACDRCLVVGSGGETSGTSAMRAIALAARLGVPTTRMTSVFNGLGGHGCGEDDALRFEMGASLRSRVRIRDGGDAVSGMLSFGQLDALVAGEGPFARSVRAFAVELLRELGCSVNESLMLSAPEPPPTKFRLPWSGRGGASR